MEEEERKVVVLIPFLFFGRVCRKLKGSVFESLQEMTTPGRLYPKVVIGSPHVLLPGLSGAKAPGWGWEGEPEGMLSALQLECDALHSQAFT